MTQAAELWQQRYPRIFYEAKGDGSMEPIAPDDIKICYRPFCGCDLVKAKWCLNRLLCSPAKMVSSKGGELAARWRVRDSDSIGWWGSDGRCRRSLAPSLPLGSRCSLAVLIEAVMAATHARFELCYHRIIPDQVMPDWVCRSSFHRRFATFC
jgi:hypothetical protein